MEVYGSARERRILKNEGGAIAGKRIVYVALKVDDPYLIRKSGAHRGSQGKLYDAKAHVDIAIDKKRNSE
ncbi:MAG: hypothetical protein ACYCPP_00635 [Nitrososphaerales archaeon]